MRMVIPLVVLIGIRHAVAGPDVGVATTRTAYDPYMATVRQVLSDLRGEETSFSRVRQLMHIGYRFRYMFSTPYVTAPPRRTAMLQAGDCKAKALWLADCMGDAGVRFVIGKADTDSRMMHAWVIWRHDSKWWILDCSNRREPVAIDDIPSTQYIPLYSFGRDGKFQHRALAGFLNRGTSRTWHFAVASGRNAR